MEVNKKIVNSILYLWIIIMYIYTAAGWRRPGPADDFFASAGARSGSGGCAVASASGRPTDRRPLRRAADA